LQKNAFPLIFIQTTETMQRTPRHGRKKWAFIAILLASLPALLPAQTVRAEYDKTRDFSRYKTFQLGDGQITTPRDQRNFDEGKLHAWIRAALAEEFKEKGLQQVDSGGDLTVTYAIGSTQHLDMQNLGPLGGAPGQDSRLWSRDYTLSTLIIDLRDRSRNLIWRVNGEANASTADAARQIEEFVSKGFRKFSIHPPKQKRKK
jgi:hypothetical protein